MKLLVLILFLVFFFNLTASHPNCGDWQPFGHSKCFKVFDKVGSYEEAEATCIRKAKQTATLATIKSAEEQEFLERYIQEKTGFVQSVWLGAKYNYLTKKFQWNDNSELKYHNWAVSNPKNKTKNAAEFPCVQMNAEYDEMFKWSNQDCSKNNVPVCQKKQSWSMDDVNLVINNILNKLETVEEKFEETKNELEQAKNGIKESVKEIETLKQNPVPVGFIYVQLPNQPAPGDIWPNNVWTDSSDQFAGLFFRVSGGNSATFGSIQEEFSPRLVYNKLWWGDACDNDNERYPFENNLLNRVAVGPGIVTSWTRWLETGIKTRYDVWECRKFMQFEMMNGEVRPRNTAVKIWKRTA